DGEIVIVDEFTGRLGEGRKWRDGIHQAVEAKQDVEITVATGQAARVTVQDFFLRFQKLAGMTGTAAASSSELRKIYHCHVIPVPTNRPPKRVKLPTMVYATEDAKWRAIVEEVAELHAQGRPILIGTRTIDKSEILSKLLKEKEIPHEVLNANYVEIEADIVSRAGEKGKVTVSTNMAGRGTDIKLPDEIKELGGLHVICTEMHESARIDRQLIGRCGRQGDPGTFRQYLCLEDELLEKAMGPKKAKKYKRLGERNPDKLFNKYEKMFKWAQRKVEKKSFRNRKTMLYYEKERKKMQRAMGQDPYLDTPN
ncbi:MAG: helicase-related protein, partial [Thermoguttaceae bacterium]